MVKENAALRWKKKKWYDIVSPETYGKISLGQSLIEDPKSLMGKVIEVNLMTLTKNIKKQNTNVKFKVIDVVNNKGITQTYTYQILPANIRRYIRAGRDRIDESFVCKSQDGKYARIKPLFVTRIHVPSALRTQVRRESTTFIRNFAAENTYEDVVKAVVDGKLQKELRDAINKLVPMRTVEIRSIQLIENLKKVKKGVLAQVDATNPEA